MRASTLGNNVLAINREIDSRYDAVIAVRDKLPEIELVAGMDLDALIAELENAQDFTGITVVSGTEVAWDAVNKVLTVPRGEQGLKGDKGDKGDIGLQGAQGPRGAQGPQGLKGDIGPNGPRGLNGPRGDSGKDGKDGKDLTVTQIVYNSDGTFTWMFSDGTNYVTPNLKGDQGVAGDKGDKGDQGVSVHHMKGTSTTDPEGDFSTAGELDTYTFYADADELFPLAWFTVKNGEDPWRRAVDRGFRGTEEEFYTLLASVEEYATIALESIDITEENKQIVLAAAVQVAADKLIVEEAKDIAVEKSDIAKESADAVQIIFLGAKSVDPVVDNQGNPLVVGVMYYNEVIGQLKLWNGTEWTTAAFSAGGAVLSFNGRNGAISLTNSDITIAVGRDVANALNTIDLAVASEVSKTNSHIADISNPHNVTKDQVGLGNVDNTEDSVKNVLSATKLTTPRNIAISGEVAGSVSFDGSTDINISTTIQPNSVALGTDTTGNYVNSVVAGAGITVTGVVGEGWSPSIAIAPVGTSGTYTKVSTNDKGQVVSGGSLTANDIPNLDASKIISGIIDAARLPAYVDDVLEYTNLSVFPVVGESGKIYIALDTNKVYRWSGSAYIYITSGAVDSVAGKTGVVTLVKADVGLANVDNTSDANKPVSTAAQNALNLKANASNAVLTGVPIAPTASVGTNTTQLATTAFVSAEIANDAPSKTGSGASGTWGISISGNAATATKLETARTINGVSFDGTANIVAPTNLAITAGTTAGPIVTSSTGTNATLPTASASASGVVTTGDQAWAGVKTFSSSPIVPTATAATQAVNKGQLDLKAPLESPTFTGTPKIGTNNITSISTSVIDNAIARYDGTTGKLQNSSVVIDDSGNLLLTSGTGALGYGAGAGGSVTQLTSKSTTVTLNKPTGRITMHNAALAAGASVDFALLNSLIVTNDTTAIVCLIGGVSNMRNYRVDLLSTSGGLTIKVTNISSDSLSEAVLLHYTIIKGVLT